MNYWVISDMHLGHDNMVNFCSRPINFSILIIENLKKYIKSNDVLINLGDTCFGDDKYWHKIIDSVTCKKWLIVGNHDRKSYSWYLNHSWDFAAHSITLNLFDKNILLSHKPEPDNGYDVNLHGHFHNNDISNCGPELKSIMNNKHRLFCLEKLEYKPILLEKLVN